ncbi:HTH_Tnp_Tc3_2 domain-containing protein [Trichonephila clavipes]|nr:HTH_Tnp_Tc3_2 domain-containing protein [Trichonephila clavipes]
MIYAGWSAKKEARQLGRTDCVERRCWYQCLQEMSFTRRPCSGHPQQTSRRADSHIVSNVRLQLTASSSAIQAQVTHLLGVPASTRTTRRRQPEGHLG